VTDLTIDASEYEFRDKLTIVDSDWVKSAFMISADNLEEKFQVNLDYSRAGGKFSDTSIGGGKTINGKPQYTRYCDPRNKGRVRDRKDVRVNIDTGNHGMGEYYSSALDDNKQILILEFGVPKFQSLFSFFTRSVDYVASIKANEGRIPYGYYVANVLFTTAAIIAFPLLSLIVYGIKAISTILLGTHDHKYYSFKSSMPFYWESVNNLVTFMSTERGFIIPELRSEAQQKDQIGIPVNIDQDEMDVLSDLLPDVFMKGTNYIDVFAIANRAQVRIDRQRYKDEAALLDFQKKHMSEAEMSGFLNKAVATLTKPTYKDFLDKTVNKKSMFKKDEASDQNIPETKAANGDPKEYTQPNAKGIKKAMPGEKNESYMKGVMEYFNATLSSGGTRVAFEVDFVGTTTDSFSNSLKDIDAKGMLNSLGGSARNVQFSLGGGNVLGDMQKAATDTIKDVAMGALSGATFGLSNVLQALLGGGYIDMPKMWDNSSANLSKHTYKMTLTSPYGNPISQIMNLDIPLAMIMAGMLPQAIGESSYTSPFLCKSFLRGIQDIDLGMITELSITRGVTNLGFNEQGRPLSLDISFTITDFSEVVSTPISGGLMGAFEMSLDDNKGIHRFISALVARDYHSSRFLKPKWILRASRLAMNKHAIFSPAAAGMLAGDSVYNVLGGLVTDGLDILTMEGRQ